jgi:hypothetical protein
MKPVVVSGRDFFGRMSQIKFSPFYLPGWHWKCGREIVPINSDIACCKPRRITLQYKEYILDMYEHIGALRWTGLDGVVIESSSMPPYHGRVKELWDALKPFIAETKEEVPRIRPRMHCSVMIFEKNDRGRGLSVSPTNDRLIFRIFIEIEGMGKENNYEFPMALEEVFGAYTIGWPPQLYYLSKSVALFGWPHHKQIEWTQENTREIFLEKVSLHRLADLLGGLSLITHDRLVSAQVISIRGGHKIDMDLIKMIQI